jgi:hypothetical protein
MPDLKKSARGRYGGALFLDGGPGVFAEKVSPSSRTALMS